MIKGLGVVLSLIMVALGGAVVTNKGNLPTPSSLSSVTQSGQVAQVSAVVSTPFQIGSNVKVVTPIAVRTSPTSSVTPTNKIGAEPVGMTGIIQTGTGFANPTSADGAVWWYVTYDAPASGCTVNLSANPPQTCKSGWSTESYLNTYTQADTQAPTVTAFSIPSTSSNLTIPLTTLTATDNVAVTGYTVNESATAPIATASGWSAAVQTSYTFASQGTKTLYAWAKDAAGNVSLSKSASVVVTIVVSNNKFNIGDKVSVNTAIAVRTSPTSSVTPTNKIGSEAVGMTGIVATGSGYSNPAVADGNNWWYINYDVPATGCTVNLSATPPQTCKSGWSTESYLSKATTTTTQTYTVTVTKSGTGSGTVSPNGSTGIAGQVITLTEVPTVGSNNVVSVFSGWSGVPECVNSLTTTCTFTLNGNVTVNAAFTQANVGPVSTSTFPVKLSADKRYLLDANNNPFPILGRTGWFSLSLPNTGTASYKTFMDDAVAKGYNSIEMHVLDHDPRGNTEPFAGNGQAPFLKTLNGSNWGGSLVYGSATSTQAPDYTTPNEAYWTYVDSYLAYAESKGLLVFFFPSYVGYGGGNQGWMQEMTANGQTKMQTYGAWVANRYKNQKNLVWMVGGDYGTGSLPFNSAQTAAENGLITGLRSVTGLSIFYSAEWNSGSIATDQSSFGNLMSLNGAYSWEGDVGGQGRRAYGYSSTRPSFLLEEPYDQEGPDGNNVNPNSFQPVRQYQWVGWLSTIGGYISGNGYVWPFNSTPAASAWTAHLNTQGAQDMARLNTFIKSIPWYNLVPSGLNGMKNLVTAGGGNTSTTVSGSMSYVAAAATPAGDLLVAYISPAHSGSITIDMTAMSKAVQARWYDPSNGAYTVITGSPFSNTGTRAFTPPGNNSRGEKDWVLVLN